MNEQTNKLNDKDIVALVFAHAALTSPDFQPSNAYELMQKAFQLADVFLETKDKQ